MWLEQLATRHSEKSSTLPSAWLSLDENDSDLNVFLRYFIAALRTVFNTAFGETLSLLKAQQQPPDTVLCATLSNDLEELPGEVILVLDDYQTLHGAEVHNLLIELAKHWPEQLHLVLISRIDPIPLSSLRAKEMINEIRTRDLRFTPQETAAYLSQAQIAPLSQDALVLLEERLDGWPAGLHLAALSLHSAGSQESVLSALSSENTNITRYLLDKVLTHQVPAIQKFLLKTSVLDRYCASLCEAVTGEIDPAWNAHSCLDWIKRSDLFIIPLDNRQEWYRYHHLFQELLQSRLAAENGPDQVADLHRLASTWFEAHELLDEALHHALAAEDLDLAVRQMRAGLREVLNREDRQTLERWLRLLPEEMIQRNIWLLMIKAFALQFLWRHDLQAQVLKQVEELLDSEGGASLPPDVLQILRGQILMLRAQYAYFSNQTTRAIDLCWEALALLPPSWIVVRGGAMIYLGLSMQANGQAQAAERLLLDQYETYNHKTDIKALILLESLCFIYLNTGQLEQTRKIAQVLIQGAIRSEMAQIEFWGDWFLGEVSYHQNELELAAQYFTEIAENPYTADISPYRDAVAGLAVIHQLNGASTEAWQMVRSISQFDLMLMGSEDERTRSLHARLLLMQGDIEGAGRWADTYSTDLPPDQPLLWFEEPQLTRARVLVARNTPADLPLVLKILDALHEIADRTHNTRFKIEILALRAVALDAQGITSATDAEAFFVLKQAVELARPEGFIRIFVDLGKPMQRMLHRIAKQDHLAETIRRILSAFSENDKNLDSNKSPTQSVRHPTPGISTLVEPLTSRELEVLTLLREPLSIKEIALRINVSYETVRRHIANLYGKLGVNRRWDAVARAEELSILPPR